jgi:PAS domain-containing protein
MDNIMDTQFLPAEREEIEKVINQNNYINELMFSKELLDAIPNIYMILNSKRQIVYANKTIVEFFGLKSEQEAFGLRPGELLNCFHSDETLGGCGTTEACRNCGAGLAIQSSLNGEKDSRECRIIQKKAGDVLDLKVWTTPFNINGENFIILSIMDISHEKRRRVLERIFFHDIMNSAGSLKGWVQMLDSTAPEDMEMVKDLLKTISNDIIDEINSQKILSNAENNDLVPNISLITSLDIIELIIEKYKNHPVAEGKILKVDSNSKSIAFKSDLVLISRVIGNLLKNAIEASRDGKTVTVGCNENNGNIEFWVHNESFIPRDIQLQIFQRSFSTKGADRGIGTYSIMLLTEKYLNGKVSFTTDEAIGTTFFASYPLNMNFKTKEEEIYE